LLKKIAPDKWKHFYVGIAMGLFFQLVVFWLLPAHLFTGAVIVFLLVGAISYGWELFSKITGWGHHEINDAIASIIGGITGMAVAGLFYWLIV
jgi:hypothetical protein